MLSDEVLEKVVERLARRMEQANTYIIEQIGKSIKKIGTLSPTKAHELVQILKYGGDYDKIIRKLKETTQLSIKDIKKIFEEVAKNDYEFAEQFYKYRNKKFIKWEENRSLRNMVESIEKQTAKDFINLTNTRAVAFGWQDKDGNITYKGLKKAYYDLLDEAVLNVSEGKETFDNALYRQLKEIGGGGIKVIFPSTYVGKDGKLKNRVMRADSAVRMQIKDALRTLHNKMQENLGKDFDSDGVEISVHLNPAPDHELVQGRQFSNKQFDNFQNDKDAVSYDGIEFPATSEETGHDRRNISQYNCYHYVFSIVLGVSKPAYTDEQLQQIIDNAHKKITFDGKEYTMYEATQLQRKLELEIRKAKDEQIMGRTSGNEKLIYESQEKITQLTDKYKELSKISKLPPKVNRMRVSGYKKVKTVYVENEEQITTNNKTTFKLNKILKNKKTYKEWQKTLKRKNVDLNVDEFKAKGMHEKLMSDNFAQLNNLIDKYPMVRESIRRNGMTIGTAATKRKIAMTDGKELLYSSYLYKEPEEYLNMQLSQIKSGWHSKVPIKSLPVYSTTHEFGHILQRRYINYINEHDWLEMPRKALDRQIMNEIYEKALSKTGLTITELKKKYLSKYGKSKRNFEAFAEIFAKMELGEPDPLTEAMAEYLEEVGWKTK